MCLHNLYIVIMLWDRVVFVEPIFDL
ncbi:hypothetical protein [Plasmodium yoelii yoelii]|uniref:Uncharacterized protein n=1 Tax=Plasmodium yoelii yoelii TaxID=73239 RepID=Q7RD03_PLAYO|nr:hypothetical protein [Plasmodium yoelii yoelii]